MINVINEHLLSPPSLHDPQVSVQPFFKANKHDYNLSPPHIRYIFTIMCIFLLI